MTQLRSLLTEAGRQALSTATVLVSALAFCALVQLYAFQLFVVPSSSMSPTLLPGDRIVVNKIATRGSTLHRGDIVVFHDVQGWLQPAPGATSWKTTATHILSLFGLAADPSTKFLVKRLVALPGDHVACCDKKGSITINGVPTSLHGPAEGVRTDQVKFRIVVPPGYFFALGDNRPDSGDSRYHLDIMSGSVPLSAIVGKVQYIAWPPDRLGSVS